MSAPLVTRSTGDIIPAADHNDIMPYIEDGTYRVNTLSLSLGGTEVITSALAIGNVTTIDTTGNITINKSTASASIFKAISSYADGYDAMLTLSNTHTGGKDYSIRSTNDDRGTIGGGRLAITDDDVSTTAPIITLYDGNVGIGIDPVTKFHVQNSASNGAAKITQFGTAARALFVDQDTNSESIYIDSEATTANVIYLENEGTGAGILINQDGNGIALSIDTESTTSTALFVDARTTTTGRGLYVYNSATYTGSDGFVYFANQGASSSGNAVQIDNAGTGDGLFINQDGTGKALNIDTVGAGISILSTDTNSYAFESISTGAVTATVNAINRFDVRNASTTKSAVQIDNEGQGWGLEFAGGVGNNILLEQKDGAATPTLAFGDGDTGIYESSDDTIAISNGGTFIASIDATNGIVMQNSSSNPAVILPETPSATNPVFSFWDDYDTGLGRAGADQLSLIAGGVEQLRVTNNQIIVPLNNDAATPSIAIGDGDTGFYEGSDDTLSVSVGGSRVAFFYSEGITCDTANGGLIRDIASSGTVPGLIPDRADLDTGIGQSADDQLSFIAGGVQVAQVNEDTTFQFLVAPGATQNDASKPSLGFGDGDTGFFETADDNLQVGIGGTKTWHFSGNNLYGTQTTSHLILPINNDGATPSLAFGDGDTGIYESADDTLAFAIAGAGNYFLTGTGFYADNANGFILEDATPTSTNPNLIPNRSDADTGIGRNASNILSLIAGATEGIAVGVANSTTTTSTINATGSGNPVEVVNSGTGYDMAFTKDATTSYINYNTTTASIDFILP